MVPWLITTPAWTAVTAHLAGAAVPVVGDAPVAAGVTAGVVTGALALLAGIRGRPREVTGRVDRSR